MPAHSDIQRLVYSPKVWAFVRTANGKTLDLSDYVMSGEVKLVLDAPSSARIVLRNPNHIFTTHGNKNAVLHPMDPITIYMQRFNGHHVQVFTGYLDTTPYLQLIPGAVQISATCTLKRLLYNYFQLGQLYTLTFFEHFGWNILPGGVIGPKNQVPGKVDEEYQERAKEKWGKEVEAKQLSDSSRKEKEKTLKTEEEAAQKRAQESKAEEGKEGANAAPFSNPQSGKVQVLGDDGSFKKLLWAVLYYMADWKDESIYIEEIPETVPELIAKLWANFDENERQEELKDLKSFWADIIGTGGEGSGGGAGNPTNTKIGKTGNLTDIKRIIQTMAATADKFHVPPAMVICTALCEESFSPSVINNESGGAIGWFQFQFSLVGGVNSGNKYEPYGGKGNNQSYTPDEAKDTGIATEAFCKAAAYIGSQNPSYRAESPPDYNNWREWATTVQGSDGYANRWSTEMAKAHKYLSEYWKEGQAGTTEGQSSSERGKTSSETSTNKNSSGGKTRMAAMEHRAQEITEKKYPYSYGGGHENAGTPSIHPEHENGEGPNVLGFDCSGSVGAVLSAGGFLPKGSSIPGSGSFSGLNIPGWQAGESHSTPSVNLFFNSSHAWMTINGRYFSTGWNEENNPHGGAGYGSTDPAKQPTRGEYTVMSLSPASLKEEYTGPEPPPLTNTGEGKTGIEAETAKAHGIMGEATAAAFLSQIAAPTAEEWLIASAVGGQRALMNATPVMDLIEQICKSSLRHFQSLPNGDFHAFYPDYFGEFGHNEPYWQIKNIEITSGTIELTDNNLVTHYFAIGDVTWPASSSATKIVSELYAGAMTVYEAFQPGLLLGHSKEKNDASPPTTGNEPVGGRAGGQNAAEAAAFLQRYGARPAKAEYSMVYSALFDQLLAYQQFLLAWARQFQSTFTFTFMPELFPGGKVGFPEHGLKMYIEEVTHIFDYENGFETGALLVAPSVFATGSNASAVNELPANMAQALLEPQKKKIGSMGNKPIPPPPPAKVEVAKERRHNESFGPVTGPGVGFPTNKF